MAYVSQKIQTINSQETAEVILEPIDIHLKRTETIRILFCGFRKLNIITQSTRSH